MKSNAERNQDWRDRLAVKAAFFDAADEERRQILRWEFAKNKKTPEREVVRRFFSAYPRCRSAPTSVFYVDGDFGGTHVVVSFDDVQDDFHAAAALVALSETTSVPLMVTWCSDENYYQFEMEGPLEAPNLDVVRREVAEMRRLNIWKPEA